MTSQDIFNSLTQQLKQCMQTDHLAFKRQLDRFRTQQRQNKLDSRQLDKLAAQMARSVARYEQRRAVLPVINFPDLPVSDKVAEISDLIKHNQVVILCGETGSGKTTQIPKICLQLGRGIRGLIGHTQPRRIAARTVADRIAEELGQTIGQSVGYKVRFHDKVHERSHIKLMTDGILLAETQSDPYLNQYDTLIIDEAHERSLNIDFLLGYMKWLLPKRRDLKLIITSATIDPERFSSHFDQAPIINVSGRTYPVEIRYRPIEQAEEDDETSVDLQSAILDAVAELHRDLPGDILIFLSGEREIRETTESLRKHNPYHYDILPLYSKLSVAEQEQVFKPSGKQRIVLATNVAETSLTVPGIRSVIDTGHARISRYNHRSKIQRLPIERISQASANQRAGRCGRVAEGICIRLYGKDDFLARPEFTDPEILRTSLASVILQMATLKLADIEKFPFVEPPDDKMIRDGKMSLQEVNALDSNGQITETGYRLAKIPADPRLARMLLAAESLNCIHEVAIIVAGLSIQDPREKPVEKQAQAESKHAQFRIENSDFLTLLNIWNVFEEQKKQLSNNQLRKYCKAQFLSYIRMREWFDIHAQIMQVVKGELKMKPNTSPANYEAIHCALLPGLLSNIGFRHEQYEYLGGRNVKFFIFPGSGLHKVRPKWIMAAEQVETSKIYARTVAHIEPEWIEQCAGHLIKSTYYEPHWEKKAGRSAVFERLTLYGLTIQPKRKIPYERVDPKAARELFIRCGLVAQDYHTNAPFFKANTALLEEVGYIQHKGRRVDLVEDEEWLYRFYDKILPAEVVNGITLDQWRKKAEKQNPKILFLTKEDLTRDRDDFVSDWDYPDHKQVGNLRFELQYRFEPGHDEDGVTAIIPVHQLNQVRPAAFDWLVPGMLEEKVTALIKTLPKQRRKLFVPVPQTAKSCVEVEPEGQGSLFEWLSHRLRRLTGESVPLTEWQPDLLPDHLKMNFRVVDDQGRALGYGRNLLKLQDELTHKAGVKFDEIAADELNFTACIDWAFDDLPETYQFIQNGQTLQGFPALVDEGESVGVKIFDTQVKAEASHCNGLIRLFQLKLRKECQYILKNLSGAHKSEMIYARLPDHPWLKYETRKGFKDDFLHLLLYSVFVQGESIRTQVQFENRLAERKGELLSRSQTFNQLIGQIMPLYADIQLKIKHPAILADIKQDIEQQLIYLMHAGFLRYITDDALASVPRYLKAILYRLEKQKVDPQAQNDLMRFWRHYWDAVQHKSKKQLVIPEQDKFRWDLEEFRVSIFAQPLKTAYPVSAKRLEKAWNEKVSGG